MDINITQLHMFDNAYFQIQKYNRYHNAYVYMLKLGNKMHKAMVFLYNAPKHVMVLAYRNIMSKIYNLYTPTKNEPFPVGKGCVQASNFILSYLVQGVNLYEVNESFNEYLDILKKR